MTNEKDAATLDREAMRAQLELDFAMRDTTPAQRNGEIMLRARGHALCAGFIDLCPATWERDEAIKQVETAVLLAIECVKRYTR